MSEDNRPYILCMDQGVIPFSQFAPTYDVSRGRENPASQEANPPDESKEGQRAAILKLIEDRGQQGTTLCDIQRRFGWEKNAFSGRLTELMDGCKLYIFGPKREKCSVYYPVRNA